MQQVYNRLCLAVWAWCLAVACWAQDDDDEMDFGRTPRLVEDAEAEDYDFMRFHVGWFDIVQVAFLVLIAYLLSKVWKGCSYIFIAAIIAIYLMNRYLYL